MGEERTIEPEANPPETLMADRTFLEKAKDFTSIIQSVAIVAGIIVGAILFFMQAGPIPRANISHSVIHRQINDKWTWVRVSISIFNPGNLPLSLEYGTFRLQGILPLDTEISDKFNSAQNPMELLAPGLIEVNWPRIGNNYEKAPLNFKLNPGEKENLIVDFFIPSFMQTIQVYTYFGKSSEMGWSETSIYEIPKEETK